MRFRMMTAAALAAAALTASAQAPADAATVVGSSGSHVSGTAEHRYGKLSGPAITSAALVNIETTVQWSQVASGGQDANIRRWADALRGKSVMVSFSHEPMAKQNTHWGSASQFVAAWKHVVGVFRAQRSTSVKWVWNATSDSFRGSHPNGAQWYPGDSYVDYVAGEAYNRVNCGQTDQSVASKVKEILAFARQHGKGFVVAEFASNAYSGRASWLRSAKSFFSANGIKGAFYYNSSGGGNCHWQLNSSEQSILRSM